MIRSSFYPRTARAIALALLCVCLAHPAVAAPKVAVTLKPLHSLVAGVMGDVGTPDLLITGASSPHNTALKPSQLKALHGASVVFLVDEHLEQFATRALAGVGPEVTVVPLMDDPSLTLLPGRNAGVFESRSQESHGDEHDNGHDHAHHTKFDAHVWLSPQNATAITQVVSRTLQETDPDNAAAYAANAKQQIARIQALEASIKTKLEDVKSTPYFVYHDAWIYFETAFTLKALGAVAPRTGARPGTRRVRELRERVRSSGARCIFEEPQFSPKLVATLAEGTDVKTASIDPIGAAVAPGADAWFTLMSNAADSLHDCLKR